MIAELLLSVRAATVLGALLAGEPQLADDLIRVARRESGLSWIGVHARDAGWSRRVWPRECGGDGLGWSTRGAHGQIAAYALQYGPAWARCSPWLLDLPIVSAYLAARRAASWRCRQTARCRSWIGTPWMVARYRA